MAIASVSGVATSANTSDTTVASPAQAHVTGNLIVVGVRWYRSSAQDISSVVDTAGNTYTFISSKNDGADQVELWYAYNVTGNASNVVTVTFSGITSYRVVCVGEFSGAKTSATPLDQAPAGGTATTASVTTGAFTPAEADEVSVAFSEVANIGNTWTPDTGYTSQVQDSDTICMMQYKVGPATSSQTVTATTGSGPTKIIIAATFKQESGGGSTNARLLDGLVSCGLLGGRLVR